MKIICSWCKKDLGEKEPLGDSTISHGICDDCYLEILREANAEVEQEESQDKPS